MVAERPEAGAAPSPETVLDAVRALAAELYPRRAAPRLTLESHLEREAGLDSLARVELLARLERASRRRLPEQQVLTAETVHDLWRLLAAAAPAPERLAPSPGAPAPEAVEREPEPVQTLWDALAWHARAHPHRRHLHLLAEDGAEETLDYATLAREAEAIGAGLQQRGLRPGQTVAIMLPTGRDYFTSFFGVLAAGAIPVPIYPPARATQLEDHLGRHARILVNARAAALITVPEAQALARLLRLQAPELVFIATAEELAGGATAAAHPALRADDIALLQYTSGSTGNPKGVILTHANLLANIRAMGAHVRASSTDVFVSWLPLYHDMGLIGAWLGSLYYAMPLVVMSPLAFLARPERWLWAIHRQRATISGAPNFGYELCLRRIADDDLQGLDLSSWRLAFNGAEPVSPETVRRFSARFARYGFKPEALAPVYGLAECAVGLAFPPLGRAPVFDRVERETLMRTGRAVPAANEADAIEFASCGQPLPGHQIRLLDSAGHEVGEREEGRLQFRGPSATSGYYRNLAETRRILRDGWLDAGDLGYIAQGELFVTGRVKDVIIRAGRNIHPQELEETVGNLPGIRKGCVAVFGMPGPAATGEKLVVLAETRQTDESAREQLRARIHALTVDLTGVAPDEVVLAPPHSVLKTSSGKLRRAASRELYERGEIGRELPVWRQIARLAWAGMRPQLRRAAWAVSGLAYAVYAWFVFWLLAPWVWLAVAVTPRPAWALAFIRAAARLLLRLSGTPWRVRGLEQLPLGPSIIVANHASYMDGIVLTAALPGVFSFVAKREFTVRLIPRLFLRRIGAEFVERFGTLRGIEDARSLARAAQAGKTLIFFPEGTFTRTPGLRAFHLGAFAAAVEAGVPVIPVALAGTRSILRGDQWFPRKGSVLVTIGAPIPPAGNDWSAAVHLRDAARAEILRACGEPDVGHVALE